MQQGAHGFTGERIESPHYIELATTDQRTTILPLGLPFHRKTGHRMLDTLLIAAGDTSRRFRFAIAVDADYPMQAALDAMTPAFVVPTSNGPPASGASGWLLHVDAKNVVVDRILPLATIPDDAPLWEQHDRPASPASSGFAVRLIETEGRRKTVRLRTFRTPSSARRRDFHGRTIGPLPIVGDAVEIETSPYEVADVELTFGG